MKMWDVVGGTPQWRQARTGLATASNIDRIITPKTMKPSSQAAEYANQVAAERILGREIVKFAGNYYTERGKELEPAAIRMYEMQNDVDCHHVGFISNDAETVGCSPDFLVGEEIGGELKCPEADTHIGYLYGGGLPEEYKCQVQHSLFVTGFKQWEFISYHPELPPLIISVAPDAEFHEKLAVALSEFEGMVQSRITKVGLPLAKKSNFVERRKPEAEPDALALRYGG